jgi:hypothetical protein
MDNVKRLTQIYKNNISVYSSFLSFVAKFQLIKSPKYTMIFFMISSLVLYYNHCMIDPLGHELRTNMNNTLKIILLQLVYSSFLAFLSPFRDNTSPKCTKVIFNDVSYLFIL